MKHINKYGAIASGHDLTSQAGIIILEQNGNAFDAAIAASFMACVCEPVLASPGGGGFANIHTPDENYILDFFVQTPVQKNAGDINFREITANFGTATQTFHIGKASTATPGFIPGLLHLFKSYASLPLSTLLQPAITAAKNGVIVSDFQFFLSTVVEPILLANENTRQIFAPEGNLIKSGELFKNPDLAQFFENISTNPQDSFPTRQIVDSQQSKGHLTLADFQTYQPIKRQPKTVYFNDNQILLNPLPAASGVLVALAFEHLKNLDNPSPLQIAQALAFSDTSRIKANGDLKTLKALLNPPAYRGTTHISTIDKNHNACAITISNGEGNGDVVKNCGFMLNNMLGETDVNPDGKRGWREDIRLSSMMCPTIVEHNNGHLYVLGSGGSNRIRSAIFQVLVNLLIRNQTPNQAIDSPRLHPEKGHLDFEDFLNDATTNQLQQTFSDNLLWPEQNMFFGGCNLVGITPDGDFFGVGDARRNGSFKTC